MTTTRDQRRDLYEKMVGYSIAGHRFTITKLLGFGGMGAVYEAMQTAMNRKVALKLIPTHDHTTVKRFEREALTISQLRHPNTVTVFDYGQAENGFLFLAMELLDGLTLSDVIKAEGPLPPRRAVHIASQICKSLNEAHKAGIVHRDIKPDNIILIGVDADQDFVKVLDFGIAKAVMGEDDVNLTGDGRIIGTPRYMSPEQILGEPVDHRSDVYSLGCILFEMLCGAPPFQQSTTTALMLAHAQESPPSFSQRLASNNLQRVPPYLEEVVRSALEKTAMGRPQSVEALRLRLEEAMNAVPVGMSQQHLSLYQTHSRIAPNTQPEIQTPTTGTRAPLQTHPQQTSSGTFPSAVSQSGLLVQPFLTTTSSQNIPTLWPVAEPPKSQNVKFAILGTLIVFVGLALVAVSKTGQNETAKDSPIQEVVREAGGLNVPSSHVSVHMSTEPQGAVIFVNGEDTGKKTPTILSYKLGERVDLSFELPGYRRYDAQVVVETGARLELSLVADPSSKDVIDTPPLDTPPLDTPPVTTKPVTTKPDTTPKIRRRILRQILGHQHARGDKKPVEKDVASVEKETESETNAKKPDVDRLDDDKPSIGVGILDD